ncbi:hypothetical protein [Curtobacterium sp. DN_7.5]|uniref:hypothetical protein n=1 Tax=Curtobacterium sp. DN_7.5 TaxID=3049047 RepID=UPI001F582A87|nr:hypothetical protein [Curtobacterium sp. DN_7.5]
MDQPVWNDPESSAGTMVRGALWLLQVVGEGGTFTKNQLREAFPGVSQADRRIRDLRDWGWVVHSSAEEASLLAEDQRFVKAGVAVWDPQERRKASPRRAMSSKERRAVFARDGYMCTLCGIAGAEPYRDDPVMTAVLSVSRRKVRTIEGFETEMLVTECNRCRSGQENVPIDMGDAVAAAAGLSQDDRRRLLRWMDRGRRGMSEFDRAWAAYLRTPINLRPELAERVRAQQ